MTPTSCFESATVIDKRGEAYKITPPFGRINCTNWALSAPGAGIVDKDIDRLEFGANILEESLNGRGVGDVGRASEDHGLGRDLGHFLFDSHKVLGVAAHKDESSGLGLGETESNPLHSLLLAFAH